MDGIIFNVLGLVLGVFLVVGIVCNVLGNVGRWWGGLVLNLGIRKFRAKWEAKLRIMTKFNRKEQEGGLKRCNQYEIITNPKPKKQKLL